MADATADDGKIKGKVSDAELARRMRAWARFEDESVRPLTDEEVARVLPELLELGEAFPAPPREPLKFPPIAGGPRCT